MLSSDSSCNWIVPELLKNSNYKIWKACMEDYFSSQDLWDVVIDNKPDGGRRHPGWKKKNGMALHAIKISCGREILKEIGFAKRACDAWDQLDRIQKKRESGTLESLPIFIDIEPNKDSIGYKKLLEAVKKGDLSAVKDCFESLEPEAAGARITTTGGTALHAAIIARHVDVVEFLVGKMSEENLKEQDNNSFTALDTIAAQIGEETIALQMAKLIAPKFPNLITYGDIKPILVASAHAHTKMTRYLFHIVYKEPHNTSLDCLDPEKDIYGTTLLSQCITGKIFDIATKLLEHFPALARKQIAFIDPIQDLCKVPSAFPSGSTKSLLGMMMVKMKMRGSEEKMIHSQAKEFLQCLSNKISGLNDSELEETSVREAMLEAAKRGIVEFINQMALANQRLRWFFDDDRRNIFSYAVIYRQEKVFNLIYDLGTKVIDDLTNILDSYDNNMLHLAAVMPPPSSTLHRISGAALQMQRELQWFKEVEGIGKGTCKEMINQDGLSPRDLFTISHKQLLKEGEDWMKSTAQSSTVVAALIVTIMFAAAFTVPGGNDQNTGLPMFLSKLSFKTFIVCDALSLFSSSTSVLMFLAILTSRYAEDDFLVSLPGKMVVGLFCLFFSIATMMVAFCSAITILLDGKLHFILPVVLPASIPVCLFSHSMYPLLYEISMSTFGPSIFDRVKDKKRRLFWARLRGLKSKFV